MTDREDITRQKYLMRARGICVVIPTYNNAGTIADVVSRSLAQCHDVIVVCDGCTDSSVQILGQLTERPVILELKSNKGKGAALKAGFRYAMKAGFSYAVTLDGDGQHFPEDIPVMLKANIEHPGALIVGERDGLGNADRSNGSKFANSFSNFWFTVQTGYRLRDTQTGYRLYPLKKLHWLSLQPSRYEAELSLMATAAWNGTKIISVPVRVHYPPKDERVSHFRPAKDFARIALTNTILCLLALIYGLPACILRKTCAVSYTYLSLALFIIFSMFIMTPPVFLYLSIGGVTEKKKYNLHRLICGMSRAILFYYSAPAIRYTRNNPGNEDFSRPAVIICNHQSHLDLLPMLALTPKLVILTADWVWNNPIYRYAIHHAEFLPVSLSVNELIPRLKSLTERGYSVAVYPEGTRSADCSIGRFHQGAFHIAGKLNLDIIPLVLYGTGKALPKKSMLIRRWAVHLEIGKRISQETLRSTCGDELWKQASWLRRLYINKYTELSNKIEQNV